MKNILFGAIMLFVGVVEFLINGFFCPVCCFSIFTGIFSLGKPVCNKIRLGSVFSVFKRQ